MTAHFIWKWSSACFCFSLCKCIVLKWQSDRKNTTMWLFLWVNFLNNSCYQTRVNKYIELLNIVYNLCMHIFQKTVYKQSCTFAWTSGTIICSHMHINKATIHKWFFQSYLHNYVSCLKYCTVSKQCSMVLSKKVLAIFANKHLKSQNVLCRMFCNSNKSFL